MADNTRATPELAEGGFWHQASRWPDKVALVDTDGTSWTYQALLSLVNRYSALYRDCGLRTGDHVASLLHNCVDAFAVSFAAAQTGLYHTPLNWHLVSAEVSYVLRDCQAKLLVTHSRFAEVALEAARDAALPREGLFSVGEAVAGFRDLRGESQGMSDALPADRSFGPTQYYTSGTTGFPKGIVSMPAGGDMSNYTYPSLTAFLDTMGYGLDMVYLVQGPLYHSGPFAYSVQVLHRGGTVVVMDKWDAEETLRLLAEHRISTTFMVPTMFHRLLQVPAAARERFDLSSVHTIVHAAAMCPVDVKRQMIDWLGPILFEVYGGSEAFVSRCTSEEWLAHPGTVGRADAAQVQILDDESGQPLPAGEIGLIYFHAPDVQYFGDPERTAQAHRGELMTLGDMGYVTEDGWLFLSDRRTDLIIVGGVNIYPAEVENVLLQHPAIADVAVIGLPNAEWGSEVTAVVQLRHDVPAGSDVDEASITAFAATRIAKFKVPRRVHFVPELPRTTAGKMYRRRVRQMFDPETTTQPVSS